MAERNEQYQRAEKKYHGEKTFLTVFSYIFIGLALLSAVAMIVLFILSGFGDSAHDTYLIVGFSLMGGAIVSAGLGVLFSKLTLGVTVKEREMGELSYSESTFFVGDGILATFEEKLLLHGEGYKTVSVPYSELGAYSLVEREKPQKKGTWKIILEIPERYLTKNGKGKGKTMVEAEGKKRLLSALEKANVPVRGEVYDGKGERFNLKEKCVSPDGEKRRAELIWLIVAGVIAVVGVVVAPVFNLSLGAVVFVVGVMLFLRHLVTFLRAKAELSVYEEGIFYSEKVRYLSSFLTWGEIEFIEKTEKGLHVVTPYGETDFPEVGGAWSAILAVRPDKVKQ